MEVRVGMVGLHAMLANDCAWACKFFMGTYWVENLFIADRTPLLKIGNLSTYQILEVLTGCWIGWAAFVG